MSKTAPFPLLSSGFWRSYWVTARPYLFFVSGSAGLVGLALHPYAPIELVAPAFLAMFLSYGLGQALTDTFQTDTDALSSPYRPLVQGAIGRSQVFSVSLAGLLICALIFALAAPATLILGAAAVGGLVSYTYFKRRFWGGPAWNSWIVALLPVIGAVCAAPTPNSAMMDIRLGWAAGSVFFSYACFVIIGYLKDVEADRATGYRTLCVVFGRRAAVAVSACCLALAALCSLRLIFVASANGLDLVGGGTIRGLGLVFLVLAHIRGWAVTSDDQAHPAVAHSVRGFIALHLGEAALLQPGMLWFSALLWLAFEIALAARPTRSQI